MPKKREREREEIPTEVIVVRFSFFFQIGAMFTDDVGNTSATSSAKANETTDFASSFPLHLFSKTPSTFSKAASQRIHIFITDRSVIEWHTDGYS